MIFEIGEIKPLTLMKDTIYERRTQLRVTL